MKVVKINAIWCSGCLIMNKVWKKVLDKYSIETINLDYDMDEEEVSKYDVGEVLPVFLFYNDSNLVTKVVGEKSFDEMCNVVEEVINNEKNN